MRISSKTCAMVALAVAAGGAIAEPTLSAALLAGDNISGIGNVTTIDAIAINNGGTWLVQCDTNHADTTADNVVLRSGAVLIRENDPAGPPPGAVSSFDSVNINNNGDAGWNLFLRNLTTSTDSGLFFNGTMIFQESFISQSPSFSPNTPYIGFFEVKMNDANRLMVVASVDDPNITSTVDRALVWVNYDPGAGTFTETVVAKEGDVLPGVSDAVTDFGTGIENFAINNAGSVMFAAALSGATATNGALYIDTTLIARKGDMSPLAGRTFTDIGGSTKLDMNENGDYVFKSALSGDTATNSVLIRNGAVFKTKGDPVPGVPGETISTFGTGPVRITNTGDVVWWAQWTGDTTTNTGLFINDTLLVRRGVTTFGGQPFTTVSGTTGTGGITEGFTISRDGRYIMFRGVAGGVVGAFIIDMGPGCIADFNGSGGTPDDADVAAFFAAWNAGDSSADVNGSGGTPDDADVTFFFQRWNEGC